MQRGWTLTRRLPARMTCISRGDAIPSGPRNASPQRAASPRRTTGRSNTCSTPSSSTRQYRSGAAPPVLMRGPSTPPTVSQLTSAILVYQAAHKMSIDGRTQQPTTARSQPERLRGVMAPVLTPFRADLSPDAPRFSRHCKWLLEQGCNGLAVFGTTSEANSLSVEERESLLEHLLGDGITPETLLPGTGCCALTDTVRLTRVAV